MSVIYYAIGIALGICMGMADASPFTSARAHIDLLGWASMAIAGVIYSVFLAAILFFMNVAKNVKEKDRFS